MSQGDDPSSVARRALLSPAKTISAAEIGTVPLNAYPQAMVRF